MQKAIRYFPTRELPPYSYVPGLAPHPVSDPRGHLFGNVEPPAEELTAAAFSTNETYLVAIDLFNHGYYWEAHEEWEQLWHLAGRKGATADFLKGLIKLAAAGVKLREGRATGVEQHARRAAELLHAASTNGGEAASVMLGLRIAEIRKFALHLATNATEVVEDGKPNAARTIDFVLRLEGMEAKRFLA
jgi:hypothetical protein